MFKRSPNIWKVWAILGKKCKLNPQWDAALHLWILIIANIREK
jgi:hypothetical protein